MAGWHCPRPSGGELERWAADRDPQVRLQALWFRRPPASVVAALAGDPDPQVRAAVCEQAWPHLDAERRAALSTDPSPDVRGAADRQAGRERPMSRSEYDALDPAEQGRARSHRHLDDDLARHLLDDPEYAPRATLAGNPWLSPELVAELAEDDDYRVRDRVAVRPDATEELRARITSRVPEYHSYYRVEWVEDLHDDPEAMRRLARSASVAVRRSVARARLLPPDVLDLLARDPDSGVRSNLASHNEHAPAEVLLEAAVEWTWPGPVLRRPDFPRDALIGFADHPDPMRRRLAPDAPGATAELVERLADDPDGRVRLRAAADPRLSPATALRLLAGTEQEYRAFHDRPGRAVPETHSLREAVIGNPRLPVAALVGLLRDPHSARDAAANPAVPAAVAHRMIDLACGEG
ncbi:PE-PGRS family protein [Kitasatospora terrestris]